MPLVPAPSSCMLVFPTSNAPHDLRRSTQQASFLEDLKLCNHFVPPSRNYKKREGIISPGKVTKGFLSLERNLNSIEKCLPVVGYGMQSISSLMAIGTPSRTESGSPLRGDNHEKNK